jgi:predicted transcriptional regulator
MVANISKTLSPLQQRLLEGLALIPDWIPLCLIGDKKAPLGNDWPNRPYTKDEVREAIMEGATIQAKGKTYRVHPKGYGVITGRPVVINGQTVYLMAVDQDGSSAKELIQKLSDGEGLPETYAFTSNRPGRCQFLFTVSPEYASHLRTLKLKTGVKGDDGKPEQLELRWSNLQSVLPPSVHPETGCYRWVKSPEEVAICASQQRFAIAPAPMWVIEAMLAQPEPTHHEPERCPTFYTAKARSGEEWSNEEWALSYLSALNSYRADDYYDWVAVGMALHSVSDSLLTEWDNWSRQSSKYKSGCCEKKWKSFKRQGVAIGTLAHMAKQDGWRSPFEKMDNFSLKNGQSARTSVGTNTPPQKLPLREAIEKATQILKAQINSQFDSLEASILLEELRQEAGVNEYNWERKYLKPLREKLERSFGLPDAPESLDPTERKRLELKAIAQERDIYKFTDKVIGFCRRTGWTRRDVEQQIRQLKNCTVTPKAKRLKGKDFLALETESISWVFPGIIPSRGVFVIGGHAGAGKTTFAYDAVGSLLLGEEFLGEKPVKTGKVLIVTGDELPCFTQDKLIDRGIPLDNEDWEIILNWDVSQWDVLEEAIADIRPALVVIDSFSSIHRDPSFDENSSQAKSTIYDLEALTNAYGCGCILIHHLSKSKENQGVAKLRGSSAISAAASVVCLMEQTSNDTRKLSFPKVRGAQTEPFLVALDGSTGRYEVVSGGDNASTKSLGDRILSFLQKSPHKRFEQDEISEALGISASNKDSVYQALGRLFKRGLIIKRPSQLGGRRKVYGISNPYSFCDNNVGDDSSRNVTDAVTDQLQDTHTPFPLILSVQISETIDISGLELTDNSTDNLTDSQLTPQNDVSAVSGSNQELESVSAKLTDPDSRGCVCPPSVQLSEPADIQEIAQAEPAADAIAPDVEPVSADEETLVDLAAEILGFCDSREQLEDIRQMPEFTPALLNQASKRLSAQKHAQIKTWLEQLTLQVGDRVNWLNCPAHCSNLAPFEIMAIDSDCAKLDLFEKPIPLVELKKA